MKQLLPVAALLMASSAMAEPAPIQSQTISSAYVNGISPNGEWMVSQTPVIGGIRINNLVTGQSWELNPSTDGTGFNPGSSRCASNDGTVVFDSDDRPAVWKNGNWEYLPAGKAVSGYVGNITPDARVIAGALSSTGLSLDAGQMSYPCVWYLQEDGKYSDPVFLPNLDTDFLGHKPQYVHAISPSDDGSVIAGTLTDGSGFFVTPVLFTRNETGEWKVEQLGLNLLNPTGRPTPEMTEEYDGPDAPAYEDWLAPGITEEDYELNYYDWYDRQLEMGVDENLIPWLALTGFWPDYMEDGEEKDTYLKLAQDFLSQYVPWYEAWKEYEDFRNAILESGVNFLYNNAFMSPDGKYAFFTGRKNSPSVTDDPEFSDDYFYSPVRYDVENGTFETFSWDKSVIITSVTADYSILGQEWVTNDRDFYRDGYIYPQSSFEPVSIPTFMLENGKTAAYNWIEQNMYMAVATRVTASNVIIYEERYTIGLPIATTDLSVIAFANSTVYWEVLPADEAEYVTFVLNTGYDYSEVENVEAISDASVTLLPGGNLEVKGDMASLSVYDLSGSLVAFKSSPSGIIPLQLPAGVYVIRALSVSGNSITLKAVF